MSMFEIVFLDGERIKVDAIGFSVAKVKAAYERMVWGATKHTELTPDDKASSEATKIARRKNRVVIYGPQGAGKTLIADQLMAHYGCERLLDEWDGVTNLQPGDMAITNQEPPNLIELDSVTVVDIYTVKAEVLG